MQKCVSDCSIALSPTSVRRDEAALEMVKDARRAADIIDRVRSLYQKGSSQLETIEVNEVIGEMVVILQQRSESPFGYGPRRSRAKGSPQ